MQQEEENDEDSVLDGGMRRVVRFEVEDQATEGSVNSTRSPLHPPYKAYAGMVLGSTATQIEWGIQYVLITPMLLRLGASPEIASVSWLLSPFISLFLVPWVGRCSDHCTSSLGRRTPYLIVTSIIVTFCLAILPLSAEILKNHHELAALGVFMFVNTVLDTGNSIHDPLIRSLATDLVMPSAGSSPQNDHQALMQSALAGSLGLGNALGSVVASVDYSAIAGPFTSETVVFLISSLLFAGSSLVMMLLAKEKTLVATTRQVNSDNNMAGEDTFSEGCRLDGDGYEFSLSIDDLRVPTKCSSDVSVVGTSDEEAHPVEANKEAADSLLKSIWTLLQRSHVSLKFVCLLHFTSHVGLKAVWMYATAFFANTIFAGVESADANSEAGKLYSDGVRRGALALLSLAIVAVIVSSLLPVAIERLSLRLSFCVCQLVAAVCCTLVYFVQHEWYSVFLVGAAGVSCAASNSIPYVYVGLCVTQKDVGLATSVIFFCQTFSVFFVAGTFGSMISWSGDDFATPFLAGGAAFLFSGVLGLFVPTPPHDDASLGAAITKATATDMHASSALLSYFHTPLDDSLGASQVYAPSPALYASSASLAYSHSN